MPDGRDSEASSEASGEAHSAWLHSAHVPWLAGGGRCGSDVAEPLPADRTGPLSWADSASALVVAGVGFEPT